MYPLLFFPAHGKILAWAGRKIYLGREGYSSYSHFLNFLQWKFYGRWYLFQSRIYRVLDITISLQTILIFFQLFFCPFHIHLLLKRLTDLWCKNTTFPRNFQSFREKYLKRMRRKKNRRLPETRAAYWMLFLIPFVESLFDFFNGRKAAAKIFRQSLT